MASEKLTIRYKENSLLGKVKCPMFGFYRNDTYCASCRHCRIIEYEYVKCSYKADKIRESKDYSIII